MSYITKKIQTMFVQTPNGELTLSAKAGEDPEFKLFVGAIESSDDAMTNDGQMIKNYMATRTYIEGVFAYKDSDMPKIQSTINSARVNADSDVPINVVMTDGTIFSNTGAFVNAITYDGTGTLTLRFESALDFIQS